MVMHMENIFATLSAALNIWDHAGNIKKKKKILCKSSEH